MSAARYVSTMEARELSQKEMSRAMLRKDASYDGLFYLCVKTTGVFCRPACGARTPLPKNVVFHRTVRDCLLDGFRPCKRCRPLARSADDRSWLELLLARVERDPSARLRDADLTSMGVSPHRARRYFLKNFGMTFQAYHRARRMGMALLQLQRGEDQTAAAYDQSYESLSGFRDAFQRVFGATPGKSRSLDCLRTMRLDTPLGPMVAAATDDGVCLFDFADRRALEREVAILRKRLGAAVVPGRNAHLDRLERQLEEYFDSRRTRFDVPLVTCGTPFQEQVWAELCRIPHGATISYVDLARRIGRNGAQRAVGRANGDNRLAILIPCHRVVREDGTLCGYGGGLWRKQFLLNLENRGANSATSMARHAARVG